MKKIFLIAALFMLIVPVSKVEAIADSAAPIGSIKINYGVLQTASLNVPITLSATDPAPASGLDKMRFSNTNKVGQWSQWQTYGTYATWNLGSAGNLAEGTRKMYVQFKDKWGNESAVYSDTIIYNPRKVSPIISVVRFHPDAAGTETSNLNDEYVVLKNNLRGVVDMTRWNIKDLANNKYAVPTFKIWAGGNFVVRTGTGKNTYNTLYMKRSQPIWNNDHDTLYLYTNELKLVLKKSY